MGEKTLNEYFYKPDHGASGLVEKGKFDDALDMADAQIEANKSSGHTQGTCLLYTSPSPRDRS